MKNFTEATETDKTPSSGDAERSYRQALKLERDRERQRRQTAQGKFESSMDSLENLEAAFEDPTKIAVFSDGGAGEERLVATCDGDYSPEYYRACVKRAMNRLRNRPELQKTLRLVVKNGNRREDSMWALLESGRCPT